MNEYYDTFKQDCRPIGQTVNPNIAMLAGLYLHEDARVAQERGLQGQQFFKWALAHYYRFGAHLNGRTNLWEEFKRAELEPMAGVSAVGDPKQARAHFAALEDAGVDQLILLQQAGNYPHEEICASLELTGAKVLPEFAQRHQQRHERKMRELEPYIEKALSRCPTIDEARPVPVVAYPRQWEEGGRTEEQLGTNRAVGAAALWKLHVGASTGPEQQ